MICWYVFILLTPIHQFSLYHSRIVFDGLPEQLTTSVAREIYGAGADFSEAATSTEIETLQQGNAVVRLTSEPAL